MTTLFLDTETFSDVPLKRGHTTYFESPAAQIMVATWALDDGPVQIEDLTRIEPDGSVRVVMPSRALREAIATADEIVIQNSAFDRKAMSELWGIKIEIGRVFDTMACAMAHSLPGALGKVAEIMGVPEDEAKDAEGKKLIQLFCVPRPKKVKVRRATKATHPEEWARFLKYAGSDISAMRHLHRVLPRWNYQGAERRIWELDQAINERGFRVDVELAQAAIDAIAREQHRLKRETHQLTNGEVESASQRDDLLSHIFTEYGIYLPDLKKDTLERRLDDPELPDALKQLIRVRLATATTSTAKYAAVLRSVSHDERIKGALAYCGALRTGRWAGRIFQPQNLPRPSKGFKLKQLLATIEATKAGCLDLVSDTPMRDLADSLRGMIIASPGHHIFASDLSNIEGRIAAWLAGEQWKLDAFAEIDQAKLQGLEVADMYQRAFGEMFGIDPLTVKGDDRQVGKVSELANGYEGGVGAALAFAAVYRLKLDELAEEAYPRLPYDARVQAEVMWDWRKKKGHTDFGLQRRTFVVFEAFKSLWRSAHEATSGYWGELDQAAKEAIRYPKHEVACRRLVFEKRGAWLRLHLPSGRYLCYPAPRVETQRGNKEAITYAGVHQYTRKWTRISTYGGKLFENATQGLARDVMADAMEEAEATGFQLLLTVHDELITEGRANGNLTVDLLSAILAKDRSWLKGCPLAAGGFEADRYRKDD